MTDFGTGLQRGAAVLVTGGAGYIGAHTCKALRERGFVPVAFDDLSSGYREAVQWGELVVGDIRSERDLGAAIAQHGIQAVINFAGLIEVGRSVTKPDIFYDINVAGLGAVLNAMRDHGLSRIVFSSSAAVYGQTGGPAGRSTGGQAADSLSEDDPKAPLSPYGETKLVGEWMIAAYARAFGFSGVALRYFNAAGADPSGLIGEGHDPETHLIPLALAAALGLGKPLTVFGADFPTPDGSCLRDYIHVNDLAEAHVRAVTMPAAQNEFVAMNVGTGNGCSVLEVIAAVERELGVPVPHSVGPRREGDPARLVANPAKAMSRMGWSPVSSSLDHIVKTAAGWARAPRYSRRP